MLDMRKVSHRTTTWIFAASLALVPSVSMAKPLEGVGNLKFGMSPQSVQALPGCSSSTECLYELLGKNRYFTLHYDRPPSPHGTNTVPQKDSVLQKIDVDMGNYTGEWFLELFEVLQSQYSITHSPTEQEDARFQKGQTSELIIGFAEGHVLLKIVRRTFGNLILRIIFQDTSSASGSRQTWAVPSSSAIP